MSSIFVRLSVCPSVLLSLIHVFSRAGRGTWVLVSASPCGPGKGTPLRLVSPTLNCKELRAGSYLGFKKCLPKIHQRLQLQLKTGKREGSWVTTGSLNGDNNTQKGVKKRHKCSLLSHRLPHVTLFSYETRQNG